MILFNAASTSQSVGFPHTSPVIMKPRSFYDVPYTFTSAEIDKLSLKGIIRAANPLSLEMVDKE